MNTIFGEMMNKPARLTPLDREHRMWHVEGKQLHHSSFTGNDRTSEDGNEESISQNHHEVNITEGGEFLDDALRMEDLDEETDKKPSQKV